MNVSGALAVFLSIWDEMDFEEKIKMMHDIYIGFTKSVLELYRSNYKEDDFLEKQIIDEGDQIMAEHVETIKTWMEKYEKHFDK